MVFQRPTPQGRARPDHGISSPWGPRVLHGREVFHHGEDYYWVTGDPSSFAVYGVADGTVISVQRSFSMGLEVTVEISASLRVRYSHLASSSVEIGNWVTPATRIGFMGDSGSEAGGEVHLHFEVWTLDHGTWIRVDPEPYFSTHTTIEGKAIEMLPLLINDGHNKFGGGQRTYIFGSGLWLDTTGMPTANEVSVLLIGLQKTPNLTYDELYEYAKASNALSEKELEPYRKAAGK